jgi:hypothetical protein
MALSVHQSIRKPDLEPDLFATQRRSGGQSRDLDKRLCDLIYGFN